MGDHEHNHPGADEEGGCPMSMLFHGGACESILFKAWTANTVGSFVASAFGIFFIAVLYEGLKYLREKLYNSNNQRDISKISLTSSSTSNAPLAEIRLQRTIRDYMFNRHHYFQTFLHFIQVAMSYLLMLIVMTFNLWLCLAVVLGAGFGYFFFGWIRQRNMDVTEHCH